MSALQGTPMPLPDGTAREALVYTPEPPLRAIAVVFHPLGDFGPGSVIDGEPAGTRLIRPIEGMRAAADAFGLVIVAPFGRGRAGVEGVSLAWQPHLRGGLALARDLRRDVGNLPIVSGGLSQGGLEALALASLEPDEVQRVWAVNPLVDLARVLAARKARRDAGTASANDLALINELDGDPSFEERSPLAHLDALARVGRILLVWSPDDTVVEDPTAHGGRLAAELRRRGARIDERRVTFVPERGDLDAGRFAHESCDVWAGAAFLAGVAGTR